MTVPPLPPHLRVALGDQAGQYASARCARCGARAYIARYEDPSRAAEMLARWVERHAHGVQP